MARAPTDSLEPVAELSSPACLMHEASDEYMGYAGRREVVSLMSLARDAESVVTRSLAADQLRGLLPRIRDQALRCQVEALLAFPTPEKR